ncbi:MAG: hypothetical protein PQJ50_09925 [Spirochaetales bacterium]|nr:hypothetical protein [Spirochaetales bacterium]
MGIEAVNEEQNAIIEYVKNHFVGWMEEKNILPFPRTAQTLEPQLLERMVRVEETLKRQNDKFDHQNEKFEILIDNIDKRFNSFEKRMDERFEESDRRFDSIQKQMDQRFNRQSLYHLATFTAVIGTAVTIILGA